MTFGTNFTRTPGRPPRPRILQLIKTGEGATWAVRLVRELVAAGYDIHVAVPAGPRAADYERAGAVVHLATIDFSPRRPWTLVRAVRELRALVDRVQPDLIHSHFVSSTLLMRLAFGASGPQRVFQVPGPLHLEHVMPRTIERLLATPRDTWLGGCTWTRDHYLQRGLGPDRVGLAWYGNDFQPTPVATGHLQRVLGLPADTPVILMVGYAYAPKRWLGQTRGLKGHEDLLDAFAAIADQHPSVHLAIVGGPWGRGGEAYFADLQRRAAQSPVASRIHFTGTRPDVAQLYPDAVVAVHPSHSENLGGAAESQMMGVPTIATRVGGFPDIVEDGISGWLVPPATPAALAVALDEALRDPRERAARAVRGRQLAESRLQSHQTAGQVIAWYRHLGFTTAPRTGP